VTPSERQRRRRLRRIRITGWTALSSLLVTLVGFLVFFHIVFPADRAATLEVFRDTRVQVYHDDGRVIMSPTDTAHHRGILYFPGARVNPYSYLHPFVDVVAEGATLVVVDPLFHMALLDPRDVDDLTQDFPGITHWVVAGHSLGGVKACLMVDNPAVRGLVLFASYCASDIRRSEVLVIQVVADQDLLITPQQREDSRPFLPDARKIVTLTGANHASFGTYGPQPGDGMSTLDRTQMRAAITEIMTSELWGD
jgi:hypothetical protein